MGLTGTIPDVGRMTALEQLNLHRNQLSGSIPTALGSLPNLERMILNHNSLTWTIPTSLTSLTLTHLNLVGNSLTGCIPVGLTATNNDLDDLGLSVCTT